MGNLERNSYVKQALEEALLAALSKQSIGEIQIQQLCEKAEVSRNSFYRNYKKIEDILLQKCQKLLEAWRKTLPEGQEASQLYAGLFSHIIAHKAFYELLRKQGLFRLFREAFLAIYGPKEEHSNQEAYALAFIAHGSLGWIEEWFHRGMQESAAEMEGLMQAAGMQS